MSNYYPPNPRAIDGVGEAYPGAMDDSEAYSGDNNNMMGMHGYNNNNSNTMQAEGASDNIGEAYGNDLDQSSVSTPRTGVQRMADDHYSDDHSASHYSRSIYDDAQSRASSRTGGILHHNSEMSTSRSRRSFQHNDGSSLRSSSIHGASSAGAGGQSHLDSYPSRQPEQPILVRGVSLSGNLLVHVQIHEEPELELDKDEMKRLANTVKDNEDAEASQSQMLNDASTIGTTKSTRYKLSSNSTKNMVDGNPTILYPHNDDDQARDQARAKMEEIIFSPPFRRNLFLGICFVLLGLAILLTMENFMRVKTAQDWVEPHRDKYLLYNGWG